jgi:hypothetical protein
MLNTRKRSDSADCKDSVMERQGSDMTRTWML